MKPEKGMRIVPFEKRLKVKYPMDCEVRFRDYPYRWFTSARPLWWNENNSMWAVPSDYVFEEDR